MEPMNILVTGGAGYIGANLVFELLNNDIGHKITILDNLQNCKHNDVYLTDKFPKYLRVIRGEIEDIDNLLFDEYFDVVVHLGANAYVNESVEYPDKYLGKNLISTYAVADYCKRTRVKQVLFSSTCAVYGSCKLKINENSPTIPESPYGFSKLFSETILQKKLCGVSTLTIFRFFNVAGANTIFRGGEYHSNETHLIPVLFERVLSDSIVSIFGNDYNTHDGTCLREYVHVLDIVDAHKKAIEICAPGIFNLGTSNPISNLEVLHEIEKVVKKTPNLQFSNRRPGDAESLYSDYSKAKLILNWVPLNSELHNIVLDYYNWLKLDKHR